MRAYGLEQLAWENPHLRSNHRAVERSHAVVPSVEPHKARRRPGEIGERLEALQNPRHDESGSCQSGLPPHTEPPKTTTTTPGSYNSRHLYASRMVCRGMKMRVGPLFPADSGPVVGRVWLGKRSGAKMRQVWERMDLGAHGGSGWASPKKGWSESSSNHLPIQQKQPNSLYMGIRAL